MITDSKYLLFIARLLTNQSSDEVTLFKWNFKIKTILRKIVFVLFVVICCQSLSILTKAFTGLLLETYFSIKYVPIVSNFDELLQQKELGIAGDASFFGSIKGNSTELNGIWKRIGVFWLKTRYNPTLHLFNGKFFKEVVLGKAFQLIPSHDAVYYAGQYQEWNEKYHLSDEMYFPEFRNLVISRRHKLAKKVKY